MDFPINTSRARDRGNAGIPNVSCWLVNIGTHKRPANEEEYEILRGSLEQAIIRLTNSRAKMLSCLFPITGQRGNVQTLKDERFRTAHWLEVTEMNSIYEIEHGGKQGRVDAHVILTVKHRAKLQFDHNKFQELLDEELLLENNSFIARNIMSQAHQGRYLQWAEPNLYVSFRSVGHYAINDVITYITKEQGLTTADKEREIEPSDELAYQSLVNKIVDQDPTLQGRSRGRGRGRGSR